MGVLEIIASENLGKSVMSRHGRLKKALQSLEAHTLQPAAISSREKELISDIVTLFIAYQKESDTEERKNILRTLDEIIEDAPIEIPETTVAEWDQELSKTDKNYFSEKKKEQRRLSPFLRKYFSLKAKAGFQTQEDIAEKSGLSRPYIAIIESGAHLPQQKTLQKLARAFKVDVNALI